MLFRSPDPAARMLPSLISAEKETEINRATGGFEYTFYNLFNSGTDFGLVTEYMYD